MVEGEYNPESEHSLVWSENPKVFEIVNNYIGGHPITISEKDLKGK